MSGSYCGAAPVASVVRNWLSAGCWFAIWTACCGVIGCGQTPTGSSRDAAHQAAKTAAELPSEAFRVDAEFADPPPIEPAGRLQLRPIGVFAHGTQLGSSAAEICAYDHLAKRLYVVNGEVEEIDILDLSDPTQPVKVATLDLNALGSPTSVTTSRGVAATSVMAHDRRNRGHVVFFSADGERIATLEVGYEPDMLTFTPDGRRILVANEGSPNDDYSFNPEGSISVIEVPDDVTTITQSAVHTIDFRAFNAKRDELDPSIRIYGPGASVAEDLEPEYITVSADSKTAWVACQENNAVAIVDLETLTVTDLVGLGFKDHSLPGNGLDASDQDGKINIRPWPVKGMYQPDAIAAFQVNGSTYLVTANEGDARNREGVQEETVRVSKLQLDPAAFPNADELQRPENLGRLQVTSLLGDHNGDGQYQELYVFGARSFSIWTSDVKLVYDSGDQFEQIVAQQFPAHFNSNHEADTFDSRSDRKGPEPEGATVGEIDGRVYAFIGLERTGGIVTYDVTEPTTPVFESWTNTRQVMTTVPFEGPQDLGPEGLIFIPASRSPHSKPLLIVTNEVSGTTRIFEVVMSASE